MRLSDRSRATRSLTRLRLPLLPQRFVFQQRPPRYLTQSELRAFFGSIESPRDRALFALMYLYGLRVGEVALHERGDVDFERGRILIRRLKGGNWSERPLFRAARALLASHFAKEEDLEPGRPLFPGVKGTLKKRQIQSLFSRYRDRAQLSRRYTSHSLRHSIATHLLDAGVSLEFVQDHLGHQNIRSTTIYARITDRHRAAIFEELEASEWIVRPASVAPDYSPRASKEVST